MTLPPDGARRRAGFLAARPAVSIWAAWLPVTRFAVLTRLTREDLAALRFGISGLLLSPLLLSR